tara:strand:+ start:7993 stop:11790 length:3798 start_codon:yes stop_codon:yes gene_type:complete
MEASTYTDTILLEANRKSSAEFLGGNDLSRSLWTNNLGSGIKLGIGDKISVHSAYISEIGNEQATIEIKGRDAIDNEGRSQKYTTINTTLLKTEGGLNNGSATLGTQTSDGNYSWDYTKSTDTQTIRDDNIRLTHSYYKCAQGDNYISLPRQCGQSDIQAWWNSGTIWSEYNGEKNGRIATPNPYRMGTDYSLVEYYGQPEGWGYNIGENTTSGDTGHTFTSDSTRTELSNDGKRYTLFVRKSFKNYVPSGEKTGLYLQGERDPALMDFIWYKKTVKYDVTLGFNSPANVASQITNRMNDTKIVENTSLGDDLGNSGTETDGEIKQNNINLTAESNTYELFPCSTAWFGKHPSDLWFNDNYNADGAIPGIGHVFKVPIMPEGSTYAVKKLSNQISVNFVGLFNGRTYKAADMFTEGFIRVGWKCLGWFNSADDSNLNASFNRLVGNELVGIQETTLPGDQVNLTFQSVITTVPDFTVSAAGGGGVGDPVWYLAFTQTELPIMYESCYSTVGYLRPEIQEKGRELMADDLHERTTIDGAYNVFPMVHPMTNQSASAGHPEDQKSTILTKIPWSDANLLKLKAMFDSQELYPELFNFDAMSASQKLLINVGESTKGDVSVDKMRFLWMNDDDQEEVTNIDAVINSSLTTTYDQGQIIVVASVTGLKPGMRLYFSDVDTETAKLFPADTFITFISGFDVYVSNTYDSSLAYTVGQDRVYFTSGGLGCDNYKTTTARANASHQTGAVFFDYNPDRKDIPGGEGLSMGVYDTLSYGFAKKVKVFGKEYIGLWTGKYQSGTLPVTWFKNNAINQYRCIGFDKHFNAYSTSSILLTNGYATVWGSDYDEHHLTTPAAFKRSAAADATFPISGSEVSSVFRCWQRQPDFDGWILQNGPVGNPNANKNYGPCPNVPTTARVFNELYCGANQPAIQFTDASSRFSFVNLHTPELIGTDSLEVNAGKDVDDSPNPCYKVNKRLSRLNYSPNFLPYNNVFKVATSTKFISASNTPAQKDNNITPYAIMDAQAGIYIEDYGCDEANWTQSLWDLLGFTYAQFHNVGSRLIRFTDSELTTSTPTTNAVVKTEDVQNGVVRGPSGIAIHNSLEINYPFWRYDLGEKGETNASLNYIDTKTFPYEGFPGYIQYPAITQAGAVSTVLEAENLPRKMLSPIYLIKSDLLNPLFIGGREGTSALPVIAVVDKSSGYGDFYTGAKDSTIFTNTVPRTIQNIKTSIVDADGSNSRVDDSSCIIYKITKEIASNNNVLADILNPPKK